VSAGKPVRVGGQGAAIGAAALDGGDQRQHRGELRLEMFLPGFQGQVDPLPRVFRCGRESAAEGFERR
jgi:hypothetical protein